MNAAVPIALLLATAAAATAADLSPRLVDLLDRHCLNCHDSLDAKGEVDLEVVFNDPAAFAADGRLLTTLRRVLEEHEMPPPDRKRQPTDDERHTMVAELGNLFDALAERHRDEPGHVVMARLTKHQYRNAIRDLTGGAVTDAGGYLPNEGGAGEGFDNVGEAQGMGTAQVEKFLEAARLTLRHLRFSPADPIAWDPVPREAVDSPAKARLDAVNDVIAWFGAQQLHWSQSFRAGLEERYGTTDGPFLAAAWQFQHRPDPATTLADIAAAHDPPLPPVPLEKWWYLLTADKPSAPWSAWARAWQELPAREDLGDRSIHQRCNDIVTGRVVASAPAPPADNFAPDYETSFGPATTASALEHGLWPFHIEVGDARELFLVVTQGGDDNRGDYAVWHSGRFTLADGSTVPWHQVTKIRGANSGRIYQWGKYHDGTGTLRADAFGTRPPGAVKIEVPDGAVALDVKLEIDKDRTKRASLQALVLREKPARKLQSFYPGRLVFGGKKPGENLADPEANERRKLLRRINIPAANRTKAGLNAERNVLATWSRSPTDLIGGPWDDQEPDEENPLAPYHLTAAQVLACATPDALAGLGALHTRLASLVQPDHQRLHRLALDAGWAQSQEGVLPPHDLDLPAGATALRDRIAAYESDLASTATAALTTFAARAWRRPPTATESDTLLALFRDARATGLSVDSALKQPLLAVLASPHFIYRLPETGDAPGTVRQLTAHELADRLAFFLWGSLPDHKLLDLATSGTLTNPSTLREQTRRMLRDPCAQSLATGFAGQLFGFVGFEDHSVPDPERFPDFTPAVRAAMVAEVEAFCAHVFRGDAPLADFLTADYSFVDATLARHYALADTAGLGRGDYQKVALPAGRGGLAGMGLFLTKTSEPLRTSPVVRGLWVYETLLGRELPSPPADVPSISQDETDEKGRSVRAQLAVPRAEPGCASCHEKIDPLGIALENFDAVGRWRTELLDGSDPDPVATTKDGVALDGAADLKDYLATKQPDFIKHFTRKLLGYALGRAVAPGDQALLDRLHAQALTDGGHFPWIVEQIVTSHQFTHRQTIAADEN